MPADDPRLQGKELNLSLSVHAFVAPAAGQEQSNVSLSYFFRNNLDMSTGSSMMDSTRDMAELSTWLQQTRRSETLQSPSSQHDDSALAHEALNMSDMLSRLKQSHSDSLGRTGELEAQVMNGCKMLDDLKRRIEGQKRICANLKQTLSQWEENLSKTTSTDLQRGNDLLPKHNIEFSSRKWLEQDEGVLISASLCNGHVASKPQNQDAKGAMTSKDSRVAKTDQERWIQEQNSMTEYVRWLASKVYEKPPSPPSQHKAKGQSRESIVHSLSIFLQERQAQRCKSLAFDQWSEWHRHEAFLRVVLYKIQTRARARLLRLALDALGGYKEEAEHEVGWSAGTELGWSLLGLRSLTHWRSLTTWRRQSASVRRRLVLVRQRRMMTQSFRRWEAWMEEERERRSLLDARASRFSQSILRDVLARWRSSEEDGKRSIDLSAAERCLQMAFSLQNSCFQRWCSLCQNKLRMNTSFSRLLEKLKLQALALAFDRWTGETRFLHDFSESYAKAASPRTPDLSRLSNLEASPISDTRSIPRYIPGIGFVGSSRTHVPPLSFANMSR